MSDDSGTDPKAAAAALSGAGMDASMVSGFKGAMDRRDAARKEADTATADTVKEFDHQAAERAQVAKEHPFPQLNLKPWTEKPPEVDPARSFGSMASMLGILFSAFTRQPLTSALNASASAMKAIRSTDLEQYQEARQAWKDNTELAMKNAEWEYKGYEAAMGALATDQAAGLAKYRTIAAAAQNKATMAAADAGDYVTMGQHLVAMKNSLATAGREQTRFGIEMEDRGIEMMSDQSWARAHVKGAQDVIEAHEKNPTDPKVQQAYQAILGQARDGRKLEMVRAGRMRLGSGASPEDVAEGVTKLVAQGVPKEDAEIQIATGLTPDAVRNDAATYLETGKLQFSKGWGASQNTAIRNYAAKMAANAGLSPSDVAMLPAEKAAEKSAFTKDLQAFDGMKGAVYALENQIPIVDDYINRFGPSRVQSWNKLMLAGQTELGDPDANAYANSINMLATSLGRIAAGGSQSSAMTPVAALNMGLTRLNSALSKPQWDEEKQQLVREGNVELSAAERRMQERKDALFSLGTGGDTSARGGAGLKVPTADLLSDAKSAIAAGTDRAAVIERLKEHGYSGEGL